MEHKSFKYSLGARLLWFVLTVIFICALCGSIAGAVLLSEGGFYETDRADMLKSLLENADFTSDSSRSIIGFAVNAAYALLGWVYVIIAVSAVASVVCFVFLMRLSGRGEDGELRSGWASRIPFDLLLCAAVTAAVGIVAFAADYSYYGSLFSALLLLILACVVCVVIFTGVCMSFAARVKNGGWWRNTVVYRVVRFVWRCLKAVWSAVRAFFASLPLIWRTVLLVAVICLAEIIAMASAYSVDGLVGFWFIEKLLLVPALFYAVIMLRRLKKGGEALAAGDLSYQVDTNRMLWEFKKSGDDLNSIGLGMTRAVEERLKSERFKTELITNVSHDIKTPLTSLINYSDLISKEPADSPKIKEYSEVLLRQSERLKKLIDDLVEASKANTGNLEVLLAPCEVGVLLEQAAGEYGRRLEECSLELVVKQPETPIRIMADGRRLWRVFDNLMNNICKYSQSGTRVYLSIEVKGDEAVISFKNTSKYPLDISPDELMERFVRGDRSRSTEGSGLGLSIARSLTELQRGTLELTVDGDLFKAVLSFRAIA